MAKLVIHGKEGTKREIPLDRQRLTIGRRKDNDICLEDKAASNQHAVIINIGRNSYLQDLKSTNGTLVNGTPVLKHTLRHGDVILIGRNHISFLDEPERLPAAPLTAAPSAADTKTAPAATAATAAATSSAAALPPVAAKAAANGEATLTPEATLNEPPEDSAEYAPWSERVEKDAPPKDMVDTMLNAIRSHREQERTLQTRRKDMINQEWKKLVEAATTLKKRLAGNSRVRFFDIARDQSEILIRIQRDGEKTGQHTILIARQHPHNPSPMETIWLIESGCPDKHIENCEEIMREVMKTVAPLIA